MESKSATISGSEEVEVRRSGGASRRDWAWGQAWIVGDVLKFSVAPQEIDPHAVDGELLHLQNSYEETLAQLDQHAKRIEAEFDSTAGRRVSAHMGRCCEISLRQVSSNESSELRS